jgi:plasmid stability protein
VATLIVRNVDEGVKVRLMCRAAENGRSMEAEVREILKTATRKPTWLSEWLALMPGFVGAELAIPSRTEPRIVDFSGDEGR